MTAPLADASQLPRGTVPGLSAPSPAGNLANLFPVVTPAPTPAPFAAPRAGKAQYGPTGGSARAATTLTADTGVMGSGQGRLIVLTLTLAAGIAAFGTWFTFAGPARKLATSLARRRGHRTR